MSDTATGTQIGSVVSFSGSVWAVSDNSHRPLTEGAPVYKGEEIVTEEDSNVEIKFLDNTVLGQGGDSAVRLDDYVYSGEDGTLDFHMVKGVLRVISGEIVKSNPENFNLTTPMATIGIQGTEVMVQIDHNREFIGVDKLGEGHTVLISNAFNQVIIDKAGMFSGVDFDGSLIVPAEMPESFISTMVRAVPLTLLDDPQEIIPPQSYQTIDNQNGEYRPDVGQEQASQDRDDAGGNGNGETATLKVNKPSWSVTLDNDGYEFLPYEPLAEASETEPDALLSVDVTITATDGDSDTATDAFSVSLTANDGTWAIETESGEYAFTQYAPLDYADLTDPDDTVDGEEIALAVITECDGSELTADDIKRV